MMIQDFLAMEPDCKNHILPSRKHLKSQIQELVNYLCKEKQVSQRLTCTERRKTGKHGIDPAEKSRIESEFPVSWEKIPHTYWLRGFCLQDAMVTHHHCQSRIPTKSILLKIQWNTPCRNPTVIPI